MNAIIATRFRTLTTRRDEILFERAAIEPDQPDFRLHFINREIVRQIDNTLYLAKRWSDEPLSMTYVHHPVVPSSRAAA